MAGSESPAGGGNPVIRLATRRPVALLMLASAVFVFGFICLARLPMDLMPEISYPSITVRTSYPGAAPEDVEDRVSRRLEQSLAVVRDLRRITSVSQAESSDVVMEFAWDADMKSAIQDVREKIDQSFLPDDVENPTILRYDPSLDPVLTLGLTTKEAGRKRRGLRELRLIAEEEIERRLESVDGVAAVKVRGGLEEEIRIEVDEALVRSRGLSLAEIVRRLRDENLDQASGLLEEGSVTYLVRTLNELRSLEEIERVPLRRQGESVIRLGEVARVTRADKERQVITRIDSRPAVKIEVFREAGANIVDLATRVRHRLHGTPEQRERFRRWQREMSASGDEDSTTEVAERDTEAPGKRRLARPDYIDAFLPADVEVLLLSDQSRFIEGSIDDLRQTALVGGLLAILVLYLFLGRFSYTAMVTLAIPFSVVATFAPMFLGGISLNIMSLGGLALGVGMLVDSSIVVLEAVFRRVEEGCGAYEAAVLGASEVGGAVFASTLTTVAVFFPIVFVEGMAGQIFRDQALTVVFSLLASLVVSLTLIPMLAARIGTSGSSLGREDAGMQLWRPVPFLRYWRRPSGGLWLLTPLLIPYAICGTILDLLGVAVHAMSVGLLAAVAVCARSVARCAGAVARFPLAVCGRALRGVERGYLALLRSALDHKLVVALLVAVTMWGSSEAYRSLGAELIPEVALGEFTALLRYPVGTSIEATDELVSNYASQLGSIPGVARVTTTIGVDSRDISATDEGEHTARFRVRLERTEQSYEQLEERVVRRAQQVLGGVADHTVEISRPALFSFRTPIEVEVRGHDLEQLHRLAGEVARILTGIAGVTDVRTSVSRGSPEVHIRPDREAMVRYGLTGRELADVLRRKNMGEVATRYQELDRKVDVRVQLRDVDRETVADLLATSVRARPGGGAWTLADFVRDWRIVEGPSEIRRIDQRRAAVVSAGLVGLDLASVATDIERALARGLEVPPGFDVEVVGQKREMERSQSSLLAALLLAIFLVYVVMASQFESLVQPFVILCTIPLAAVGVGVLLWITGIPLSITAFIGMIMLAGIVVNNAIVLLDQVNRLRATRSVREALIEAGRKRLRPILMTTATTVLAMVPLTGVFAELPHPVSLDWLFGSGQGAEFRAPLAYTVIGGLLSSTLLTLIVVPVTYSLVVRDRAPSRSPAADPSTHAGQVSG